MAPTMLSMLKVHINFAFLSTQAFDNFSPVICLTKGKIGR